jgi:predicted AlkP superfamily phosphohydrolase/phosphomutase
VKRSVVAIGLDAAEPTLVLRWLEEGRLPALARLKADGVYVPLENFPHCRAETACTTFLTGCPPSRTGRWGAFEFHDDYSIDLLEAYDFEEYQPFYALGPGYRVAVVDLPQARISHQVDGVQVLGWGAHSPMTPRASVPAGLLPELTARYGPHPTYEKDHAALWDGPALAAMKDGLVIGSARRAAICRELLGRERWDLLITYFGETHSAGHFFWHDTDAAHPLHALVAGEPDRQLAVYQAVDRAVGAIVAAAPAGATIVVFSDHGMEGNSTDLPSLVFLPELLYRWSFPGRLGLEAPRSAAPPPPPVRPRASRSWTDEVWARRHDPNPITRALRRRMPVPFFHYAIERRLGIDGIPLCPEDCRLGHEPPMWYCPAWPQMKAFALPSFSEGYVRLNVRGRERQGVVDPADYDRVCTEIETLLRQVRDARTGQPMVDAISRPRGGVHARDPKLPDADLLIRWSAQPADVVDTPLGRIGPMPFQRSGSHVERGFLLGIGPGIGAASAPASGHAIDLAPTILALLDAPVPDYMEGKPLLGSSALSSSAASA